MAQKAIVGEKVGMTQIWGDDQRIIPVTVLRVEPARVVQVKTGERDGYSASQRPALLQVVDSSSFVSNQLTVSPLDKKSRLTHLLLASVLTSLP
jgi:ribosomal protein L3